MTAPDALGRDPRVAPRCGDCGACALCDAVLAYEDRVQAPRDAHEAPLAHEPADDPRGHHGGPVVCVAGPLSRLTGNLFDADTMLPAPSVRAAVLAYEDRVQAPRDAHEAPLAHEPADDPRGHHGGPVVCVAGTHRDAAAPRLGVEERQLAATRMVRRFARYTTLRAAVEEALSANERRCLDDADDRAAVVEAVLAAIAASPDAMFVRELLGPDRLSWLSRAMAHGMTAQRLVDAAMRLSGGE